MDSQTEKIQELILLRDELRAALGHDEDSEQRECLQNLLREVEATIERLRGPR